jgi:predicted N-acetyltransferase YhbS
MGAEYPLLFSEWNCEQLRVIEREGQLVAHVGISIRDAIVLGTRLRVASIGAVGTDPGCRGQGMASALMEDARIHSRARGASLMLISGGRGLYHRLGYVTVGRFTGHRAAAGPAVGVTIAPMAAEELAVVIALHQQEPVRFLRPRENWEALLAAGMLMNQPADLLIVRQDAERVAYLAVQRPVVGRDGQPGPARVMEWAGSRRAVAGALPGVAARYNVPEAALVALADDGDWQAEARRCGYPGAPVQFSGTLGILDPARFLESVRPVLEERLGSDLGGLVVAPAGTGALLRLRGEVLELATMGELTALVFGGDTEEARRVPPAPPRLAALLAEAFPIPLLWYGYNYV